MTVNEFLPSMYNIVNFKEPAPCKRIQLHSATQHIIIDNFSNGLCQTIYIFSLTDEAIIQGAQYLSLPAFTFAGYGCTDLAIISSLST